MAYVKKVAKTKKKKEISEEDSNSKSGKKDLTQSFYDSLKKSGVLGDIKKKINFISTGSWGLNKAIGDGTHTQSPGGIPRGYITEIYGDEGCGKTTLALHVARETQRDGGRVIYADFEHSLRTQFKYIENIGVDINYPMFAHLEPNNFEQGVKLIGQGLISLKPSLIIIDSVTSMLPQDAFDADADTEISIGRHAKLTGNFLNWINKYLEKYDTALILLNQLRSVIKSSKYDPGPNETTSGGKAPKFFASIRLKMKVSTKEKISAKSEITGASEDKTINQMVKVTVEKSKLDIPFNWAPIFITFGKGINNILSIISLAENKNIFKKGSAGWYSWEDPNGKLSFKLQGRHNILKHIEEHPEILEIIKPSLTFTQDVESMKDLKEELESRGVESLSTEELDTLKDIKKQLGISPDEGINKVDLNVDDLEALESLDGLTEKLDNSKNKKDKE